MVKSKMFLSLFFLFCFSAFVFAAEETLTITTYYPSPYGSYNELSTNRLAVGYTDSSEQPTRDGDIRLRPQPGDPDNPLSWTDGQPGQISYSASKDSLWHHNDSKWVAQGGGGGCYVSYSGGCLTGFTNMGSAGVWGVCAAPGSQLVFRPPGAVCASDPPWVITRTSGATINDVGEAFVCCRQ